MYTHSASRDRRQNEVTLISRIQVTVSLQHKLTLQQRHKRSKWTMELFFVTQQSSIRSKLECQTFKRKHTSPVINLTSLMILDTFHKTTPRAPISPKARGVISSSHGLDSTRPQRRSRDGTALQQSARHFTAASTYTVGWLAWCRDQSAPVFTAASATIWASRPVAVEHLQNPRCSATYRTSRRCT